MCGEAGGLMWTRVVVATGLPQNLCAVLQAHFSHAVCHAGLVAARKQNIEAVNAIQNEVNYRIGMQSLGFSSLGMSFF